ERVREEARPAPRDSEELHDALLNLVVLRPDVPAEWHEWFDDLSVGRAAIVRTDAGPFWFAVEHLRAIEVLYPGAEIVPRVAMPPHLDAPPPDRDAAVLPAVHGHTEYLGPVTSAALASMLAL